MSPRWETRWPSTVKNPEYRLVPNAQRKRNRQDQLSGLWHTPLEADRTGLQNPS